jgi:hypothetical protein
MACALPNRMAHSIGGQMAKDGHIQKGAQAHAEGQHGEKTHKAFLESRKTRTDEESATEGITERGSPYGATADDGRHRLSEDREQHDEAEKNSELRKTQGSDPAR